jgi:ATP-dependent Lon protease
MIPWAVISLVLGYTKLGIELFIIYGIVTVIRNYLDVCLDMPWNKQTRDRADVEKARILLDREHFGLEKVKERILEFIAVRQINPDAKGKILCLVGPPGVGKTSIAISVAKAMNRKLARLSLGGVRDEAEIRGHRRTYIGAMPGRVISAIKEAGSMNPVILLDEIDKLGADYKGDPSSALLEVLDPEQNKTFRDHFVDYDFDLSNVMFITTANTDDTIPPALLDRMDVLYLTSYTQEEKAHIFKEHLMPKQMKKHALTKRQMQISDKGVERLISAYTREAGVRNLERQCATLCRKTAVKLLEGVKRISITDKNLADFLAILFSYQHINRNRKDFRKSAYTH